MQIFLDFRRLRTTRKRLKIFLRNIYRNLYYKFFCFLNEQSTILLYSSTSDDRYCNISFIKEELRQRHVETVTMFSDDFFSDIYPNLRILSRAKILVIDASSPAIIVPISKRTILINCWHALGAYKKVGFDAKIKGRDVIQEEKRIARIHRSISFFITSSPYTSRIYAKAFKLKGSQVKSYGVPRTDPIISNKHIDPINLTILYAPTYRTKNGKRFMPDMPDALKIKDIAFRRNINVKLCFRSHPTVPNHLSMDLWEDWSSLPQLEALEKTSLLITDYSSIFFDFLPFGRPILFYVPDYDEYIKYERGLYFSPYDLFPDTTCSDNKELIEKIFKHLGTKKNYSNIVDRYMSSCDGASTRRICDFILQLAR